MGIVANNHDITEHKQAEEMLNQSAAEIHDLYNNAPCGYHSLDKNGLFIQINDTELKWLGYERAELLNKLHFADILAPTSISLFQTQFPVFMERGWVKDLEFDIIRKDGSIMRILLNGTAVYDEEGHYLKSRGSVFDITELMQAQQALIASEERYRLLVENVNDVLIKIAPDGTRTFITSSCLALIGYTPEELIGKPALDIVYPDDRAMAQSLLRQAIHAADSSFVITQRVVHKDGHTLWVEVKGKVVRDQVTGAPIEIIAVIRDIRERKHAEEILNERLVEANRFQNSLKALHEVTIELTQIDELETFYRRVVELGLARLGFERLALFLYDETDGAAQGTFGTDTQGKLTNESHIRFVPDPNHSLLRAFTVAERFYIEDNITLYSDQQPVGIGWNAGAVLWNGARNLGWLVTDNLLSKTPPAETILSILGLYALTVGTLLAQKQAQITLRESEERFRQIAENIDQILFIRSVDDREMLYINPRYEDIWGMSRASLYANPNSYLERIHPDDVAYVQQQFSSKQYVEEGLADFEYRIIPTDQRIHWVRVRTFPIRDDAGTIVRRAGVIDEITARKSSEAALSASEAQYRHLVESMHGGLAVYDVDDRIIFVNDRACEIFGFERAELLGTHPFDHVDPVTAKTIIAQLEKRKQAESAAYELPVRLESGAFVYLLVAASPMLNENGEFSGTVVVITDITIQKQAETALREALAKEKELGELKSRFVSMASHEFRTPLATILASAETLSAYRHKMTDEQIERRLQNIQDQVGYLKNVMEDVLQLARMQARRVDFNPVALDLDALCRSVLNEFSEGVGVDHQLHYHCSGNTQEVKLDKNLARQVITNLVSNAIKYSPAASHVWLTLANLDEKSVLTVQDQGFGIPAADLKHLYEPFHRGSNVGTISGTGLGLTIVREAVELHGGAITVASEEHVGTTVTVSIPIVR